MAYVGSFGSLGATDPLAAVRSGASFLKRGSKGDAVRALQELIKTAQKADGATQLVVVDGDFGPATESLVKTIQRAKGLTVDGIVGKQTLSALEGAVSPASLDPKNRVPVTPAKPLTRDQALAAARDKAKQAAVAKINAQRNKGIADAKAGTYAPPPAVPVPDFDTMNYQAGWISTGKPLPPGVVHIGSGGVPVTSGGDTGGGDTGGGDTGGGNQKMIAIGIVGVAAVAALVLLKK